MAAPVVLGIARYLLGKNIKPLARQFGKFMKSKKFALDGFKGPRLSFRSWNNQLRQPILLSTHNALIKKTPIEGFLHEKNNLDTLGIDEAESKCNF